MTVNFPRGRSRSIPLRLFWRAPRISTQVAAATGAFNDVFSAVVEPTGDYPIGEARSQMWEGPLRPDWSPHKGASHIGRARRTATRLQKSAETLCDFLAFGQQTLGHIRLQRLEKLRLTFQLRFPFLGFNGEKL